MTDQRGEGRQVQDLSVKRHSQGTAAAGRQVTNHDRDPCAKAPQCVDQPDRIAERPIFCGARGKS